MFHGWISLNLVLLLLLVNFVSGFRFELMYIPHRKYQVKSHSSPWFSAPCAAAIVHRNYFFGLYQREKSSDSKAKFRQASTPYKRVLEAAKLVYANKTKESITSQKLGSHDFWQIANGVLNKGKSAIPPLFNGPVSLLSVVSKVFEKLVNNRIVDPLEKCGLFSDFQYGFRSSRSTADLLTVLSDRISRVFKRSETTRAKALDVSKAFDRVWHASLLHKLKSY